MNPLLLEDFYHYQSVCTAGPYAAFLQHAPKCTPRLGHTPKIYIGKAIFIENYHFVESDSK